MKVIASLHGNTDNIYKYSFKIFFIIKKNISIVYEEEMHIVNLKRNR